jgi:hypothetical protein
MTHKKSHSKIDFTDDYTAAFIPGINAIVTDVASMPRPTSTVIKTQDSDAMALWGDGNDFPQQVINDVRQDAELPNLLDEKARLAYAGGLIYGKLVRNSDGSEYLEPISGALQKEIDDWIMRSNITSYLYEVLKDLYWFGNAFPEIVRDSDRKKIVQLLVQPAEQCRWSKQNKNGIIETCYISANFPEAKATDSLTKKLGVIDRYYDAAGSLLLRKETNLIYPLSIPSPGSNYYQLADWNSIRASGWLAVSKAIPQFKKALLEKQMTIKYHIEVSNQYWEQKYPGFDSKELKDKVQIKETEFKTFQEVMSGASAAGGNLYSPMITDVVLGKEYALWKITAIDDKIKDGTFLEDGKDASLYKYSAIGIHPALLGTMPNNGLGGAGSNIREAHLLYTMKIRPHQDIVLEPLNYLVVPYNKWDGVTFRLRNSFMNTLDKGSQTTNTVA